MEKNYAEKTPFEKLVLFAGTVWVAAKIIDAVFPPHDTVNYKLYYKKRLVYHGVTFEDRLDARLCEHEASGKVFDDCVYDDAKPRKRALNIERRKVRRDRPAYNIHHNS